MRKYLLLTLMVLSGNAKATWVGKLDLSPQVNPVIIRELHDGNYLAGYIKPNIWHLDKDGKQILHAGMFHAWRVDHGDPAIGFNLGVDLGDLGASFGAIGEALQIPNTAKWASLIGSSLSLDTFGGYRPVHGADVHDWIYGVGAYLTHKFGLPDLVKGY